MKTLLSEIRNCTTCAKHLPHGLRPILSCTTKSKIAIIGQAPGRIVHEIGIPWDDKSGERLREWLGVTEEQFYNPSHFAIIPMGFCYPGKGSSGDLPPRPECAPLWHDAIWENLDNVACTLLIGQYAQQYYLKEHRKKTLTETVRSFHEYAPNFLPLPHPSPRNNIWLKKNPWFKEETIPYLRKQIKKYIL